MWKLTLNQIVIILVIFNLYTIQCEENVKMWVPIFGLEEGSSWANKRAENCVGELEIFPQNLFAVVNIPSIYASKEIILSANGGFIFPAEMLFIIYAEKEHGSEVPNLCIDRERKYIQPELEPWLLSKNWASLNENGFNRAVTHLERLPCQNDVVHFPANHSFVVDLQFIPALTIRGISINGENRPSSYLNAFVQTEVGQTIFANSELTRFEGNSQMGPSRCECQGTHILEQLCENEKKFCEIPKCLNPIQPLGHCCMICGAALQLQIRCDNNFDLKKLQNQVSRQIRMNNIENKIDYHIGFVAGVVQIVIVVKEAYEDNSVDIMNLVETAIFDKIFKGKTKQLVKSGQPYSPNEKTHFFAIIVGSLMAVLGLFTVTYNYYYNEERLNIWLRYLRMRNPFTSPVIFARFENTTGNVNADDEDGAIGIEYNVVDNMEDLNSGFNNPMFEDSVKDELKKPEISEPVDSNSYVEVELM